MFTKKNKFHSIPLTALLVTVFLPIIALTFLAIAPQTAQAASNNMTLQIPIPTLNGGNSVITFNGSTAPIAQYVKAIYTYAVGAVGIVAAVVLMVGGIMWITAGGNASSVSEAKAMITASLTGLVLAFTSYLLLSQVSPSLVDLQSTIIPAPGAAPAETNCVFSPWNSSTNPDCVNLSDPNAFCACEHASFWKSNDYGCSDEFSSPKKDGVCCCKISSDCNNCSGMMAMGFYVSNACVLSDGLCQANSALMNKLSPFKRDFTVTGAWPPTPNVHANGSCHDTGICVDIVPTSSGPDGLNKLAKDLKGAGLGFMQYECPAKNCCDTFTSGGYDLSGIKCVVNGTGNHFHVQMP
jgi:hypothetical protein